MRSMYRGERGKALRQNTVWDQYREEFLRDGAKTGYFDSKTVEQVQKDINHSINESQATRSIKSVGKLINDVNTAVENGIRLSVYKNAREEGIPAQQAALLAKNLTVNFNKRGEGSSTLNAFFIFFNASVQGIKQFARTMGTLK